ncbi:MAG TPA: winged helix-turn-helix domain-containing protein [Pyrinomonadaceae bacterium]|nr:PD40 domain-containing protein [Chloracidobacterium sp.]MBL0240032.1 PD40 domain-containing protein [Chloracidobacterium sp.]MBP9934510.1 PD40 domain-containing protein [Pyrinomonadaceae bacterium]HQY67010.1 winged helix-turn-helix domain-containing protein [Pyrinomonadaceae bacterium]HRA41839.1 winged helix-turn-helix domain-containing protein [Pyrinomonadaceae bacterium]
MRPKVERYYEFDNFRVDLLEKTLLYDGEPVSITPKVFDALEILLENAGHLLEKHELMEMIWPDRFVEEGNLTSTIKMLRKALSDDASEPRFIETVPRRGYRFIATVQRNLPVAGLDAAAASAPIGLRWSRRSIGLTLVATTLLLCTLVFGIRLISDRAPEMRLAPGILSEPFQSEKLSGLGKLRYADLSPDGKLVAFVNETGGKYGVWLRKLDTAESIQLVAPTNDNYIGIAFSSDGNSVYFVRTTFAPPARSGVFVIPLLGGIPKQILGQTEGWISLSPDGRLISFVRCEHRDDDFCSLFVADIDGQNQRKIVSRVSPIRIGDNHFSPDGRSIAFASGQSWNGGNDFRLANIVLETGAETAISGRSFFDIKSFRWLPNSKSILLAAMENLDQQSSIFRVMTATGETERLTRDAASYSEISLDKIADRMIAVQKTNTFQLFLSSGGITRILAPAREVVFAPDGKIIYSADDNDIWSINPDGTGQRQLTNNTFKDFSPRVSPDSHSIYFASNRTGTNQVWRMSADGSNPIQLTRTEGGYPVFVSPDEKWIYYESGLHQTLWRVSADGLDEREVVMEKMFRPTISPDGKYVAYFFRDREKDNRMKIAVLTTVDRNIVKILDLVDEQSRPVKIDWSKDNLTLNYVTNNGVKNSLWSQSLDAAAPQFVADLGDMEVEDFSLSLDGNSVAYTRGEWLNDAVLIGGLK